MRRIELMRWIMLRGVPFIMLVGAFLAAPHLSQAAVIFEDNFETANLSKRAGGFSWTSGVDVAVTNTRAKDGSHSLRFVFGPNGQNAYAFAEQRFSLGGNYPEIWVSYDLYVPANYIHRTGGGGQNNKGFVHFWSGNYENPSGPLLGTEFWPKTSGTANSYGTLRLFAPKASLDEHLWDAMPTAIDSQDLGKWVRIVVRLKYATSANNNGIAEAWKTRPGGAPQKIMSITNGRWYVSGQPGFDQGYLLGWSNSGFTERTEFFIDNVAFSTTSLLGGAEPAPKAPEAPSNLSVQ
jgi:hypothetical protein